MATSSPTLEERFDQLMKLNDEKDAQLDHLRRQLDLAMRNTKRSSKALIPLVTPKPQESKPRKRLATPAKKKEG